MITVMFLQQNMIGGRKGKETNRAAANCFALAHNVTMFEVGSVIFSHNQRTTPVGSIGCQGDREREAVGALNLPIFNSWGPASHILSANTNKFCLSTILLLAFKTCSSTAWSKNISWLYSIIINIIYDRSQTLYISIFTSYTYSLVVANYMNPLFPPPSP